MRQAKYQRQMLFHSVAPGYVVYFSVSRTKEALLQLDEAWDCDIRARSWNEKMLEKDIWPKVSECCYNNECSINPAVHTACVQCCALLVTEKGPPGIKPHATHLHPNRILKALLLKQDVQKCNPIKLRGRLLLSSPIWHLYRVSSDDIKHDLVVRTAEFSPHAQQRQGNLLLLLGGSLELIF